MTGELAFNVVGRPQPGGSKRAFPIRRKTGQIGVAVADTNPAVHNWRALVIAAADDARNGHPLLTGPVAVEITFTLRRPKSHYRTGGHDGDIRQSAPTHPTGRPDVSKLARPTIDALTGLIWRDDAQIIVERHAKRYGHPEGAHITIVEIV